MGEASRGALGGRRERLGCRGDGGCGWVPGRRGLRMGAGETGAADGCRGDAVGGRAVGWTVPGVWVVGELGLLGRIGGF
ncbi:hypothetical protein ACQ86N_06365 [Puia sp. P3]|uniref:hypothetical protein n=1 Tax=Puia sp. P3 TaxID=3423952 RepID=UPI003D66D2EB